MRDESGANVVRNRASQAVSPVCGRARGGRGRPSAVDGGDDLDHGGGPADIVASNGPAHTTTAGDALAFVWGGQGWREEEVAWSVQAIGTCLQPFGRPPPLQLRRRSSRCGQHSRMEPGFRIGSQAIRPYHIPVREGAEPTQQGKRSFCRFQMLAKSRDVQGEYLLFSPPHRLIMRFRDEEKTSLVTYALQSEGSRTTIEVTSESQHRSRVVQFFGRLLRRHYDSGLRSSLSNLKQLVESG